MQDNDEKKDIDELEQSYKQVISSSQSGTSDAGMQGSSLYEERQKLNTILSEINTLINSKKDIVEKKLGDLKNLKSEIELGLEDLKKIESKKTTMQTELDKINKIEADEKQIETEVANISAQI